MSEQNITFTRGESLSNASIEAFLPEFSQWPSQQRQRLYFRNCDASLILTSAVNLEGVRQYG
jgi:hypothetical protein